MLVAKALTLSYVFTHQCKTTNNSGYCNFYKAGSAFSHDVIVSGKGDSFGCVVVRHGKIIGEGYNAVSGNNGRTTHTEIFVNRTA